MRTVDEHPLLRNDLRECARHFNNVRPRFFHCLSLAAVPLRNSAAFRPTLAALSGLDRLLLSAHTPPRWLAWMVVIERSEERRVGKGCVSTCRTRGSAHH